MSESGPSEGLVSGSEIEELSALFDRSEFAMDPTSEDCKRAASEFFSRIFAIYTNRVSIAFPDVKFDTFRSAIRTRCRAYLRNKKN